MILADKITNERKKNGWSQEELAEQLAVSRQAVSKWESAQSIPDLQRIIKMAELFCVTTDYLLKEDIEFTEPALDTTFAGETDRIRSISMEEACSYLEMKKKTAPKIANATLMCIVSPSLLVFLCGLADSEIGTFSENVAGGIGMFFLFTMVAIAVYIFVTNDIKENTMKYLKNESFETAYGVSGMVKEKQRAHEKTYARGMASGIVLCIIAVVPLVLSGFIEVDDYISTSLVSLLLILVGIGVKIIIQVETVKESFDTLLQEGEYSRKEKQVKNKLDAIYGIYWCIITTIYLGWSFWTMNWGMTWIIWPVSGVLFAVLSLVLGFVMGIEE
ncbi:MAG: helix-turn-helix domain-containing protein [Lachnospiraceae bacterium]